MARACDLPNIDTLFIEKPDEEGPFGAKSIGEACYVPEAPALIARPSTTHWGWSCPSCPWTRPIFCPLWPNGTRRERRISHDD